MKDDVQAELLGYTNTNGSPVGVVSHHGDLLVVTDRGEVVRLVVRRANEVAHEETVVIPAAEDGAVVYGRRFRDA